MHKFQLSPLLHGNIARMWYVIYTEACFTPLFFYSLWLYIFPTSKVMNLLKLETRVRIFTVLDRSSVFSEYIVHHSGKIFIGLIKIVALSRSSYYICYLTYSNSHKLEVSSSNVTSFYWWTMHCFLCFSDCWFYLRFNRDMSFPLAIWSFQIPKVFLNAFLLWELEIMEESNLVFKFKRKYFCIIWVLLCHICCYKFLWVENLKLLPAISSTWNKIYL